MLPPLGSLAASCGASPTAPIPTSVVPMHSGTAPMAIADMNLQPLPASFATSSVSTPVTRPSSLSVAPTATSTMSLPTPIRPSFPVGGSTSPVSLPNTRPSVRGTSPTQYATFPSGPSVPFLHDRSSTGLYHGHPPPDSVFHSNMPGSTLNDQQPLAAPAGVIHAQISATDNATVAAAGAAPPSVGTQQSATLCRPSRGNSCPNFGPPRV